MAAMNPILYHSSSNTNTHSIVKFLLPPSTTETVTPKNQHEIERTDEPCRRPKAAETLPIASASVPPTPHPAARTGRKLATPA